MFLPVTITKLVRGVYSCRLLIPSGRGVPSPSRTTFGNSSKRFVCTTKCLRHGEYEWEDPKNESEIVNVVFVDKDGKRTEVRGKIGDNVLYLAHR